ncbi:MAG: hypothetical protein KC431_10800 [Myxococcales bacterium]|nr:hypothetical protein [Myxococcales bacterium]
MRAIDRIYAIPEDQRSPEEAAEITRWETERFGASFDAWRLGRSAEGAKGPEAERLWDQTMAAFEAIAATPIDPGNDEGPFWAIARAMDERRVRQAIGIVERMAATPGWTYRLNGSRVALAARLAVLGHLDEAREWVDRLDPLDAFHRHWRSALGGYLVGARRKWASESGLGSALEDLPDGIDLLQVFAHMEQVDGPPPTEEERTVWRELAQGLPEGRERALLSEWIEEWGVQDADAG